MLMAPPRARPILKWAGGKTQLLDQLLSHVPTDYDRYIEPFFGGGALFFALQPNKSIVADSNPELINLYREVASNLEEVIACLNHWRNTERDFYRARRLNWAVLPKPLAAARTIYLNKTCFNGLYRVNSRGEFNVPFGNYINPKIIDVDVLKAASAALSKAEIRCADFRETLKSVRRNDFVFLDPPYVPVSAFSDFKRYTKEQFREAEHRHLANDVRKLNSVGCQVVLTNSDTPLVRKLYVGMEIKSIKTRRHISCNGAKRVGRDLVIYGRKSKTRVLKQREHVAKRYGVSTREDLDARVKLFPPTRFMGSKTKLLSEIWGATQNLQFNTVVDLFSGSGIVGYMFKCQGKRVLSNDQMAMSAITTTALIENSDLRLSLAKAERLLNRNSGTDNFVRRTFGGLYFNSEDELVIDILRSNISKMKNKYEHAIALTALIRACMKKRPRGIFTFTGMRYDDGRKDLKLSMAAQFLEAVRAINNAIFNNGRSCQSIWGDALEFKFPKDALIYIDPPYWSPLSDNEYVRRYHFVEGLARDWQGVEIQASTKTKKFRSYDTPFRTRAGTLQAFETILERARANPFVISYSSNSEPGLAEMLKLIRQTKKNFKVVPIKHTYSFGNQGHKRGQLRNSVDEYLFLGY